MKQIVKQLKKLNKKKHLQSDYMKQQNLSARHLYYVCIFTHIFRTPANWITKKKQKFQQLQVDFFFAMFMIVEKSRDKPGMHYGKL